MIKLMSYPCNLQYMKTKKQQINLVKLLKAKKNSLFFKEIFDINL